MILQAGKMNLFFIRRSIVTGVLAATVVGLLWLNWRGSWILDPATGPAPGALIDCMAVYVASVALMIFPGHTQFKLLVLFGSGAYFAVTAGLPTYLLYFSGQDPILFTICVIAIAASLSSWIIRLLLPMQATSIDCLSDRLDQHQRAATRAACNTLLWMAAASLWNELKYPGSNPLEWLPWNIGFVVVVYAYECMRAGISAGSWAAGDRPRVTWLSRAEVNRAMASAQSRRAADSRDEVTRRQSA